MSNEEHLLENAVCALEKEKSFEDFSSDKKNIDMSKETGIKLEQIWSMAQYVVFTLLEFSYKRGDNTYEVNFNVSARVIAENEKDSVATLYSALSRNDSVINVSKINISSIKKV